MRTLAALLCLAPQALGAQLTASDYLEMDPKSREVSIVAAAVLSTWLADHEDERLRMCVAGVLDTQRQERELVLAVLEEQLSQVEASLAEAGAAVEAAPQDETLKRKVETRSGLYNQVRGRVERARLESARLGGPGTDYSTFWSITDLAVAQDRGLGDEPLIEAFLAGCAATRWTQLR
jgi:hypothetical protein